MKMQTLLQLARDRAALAALSPAALRRLQEKRLRRLLLYAYDHTEYYSRRFAEAGIVRRSQVETFPLSAFPTTDKTDLMAHYRQALTVGGFGQEELRQYDSNARAGLFLDRFHVVHSSGSTGVPRYFLYNRQEWATMLTGALRGALWGMSSRQLLHFMARRPRILYLAITTGRYGGVMAATDGISALNAQQLSLDINEPLARWQGRVRAFAPDVIMGYPSAIKLLAEQLTAGGIQLPLVRVVSCGEPLSPALRRYLEQTLRAPVINFYAASESLALGVEPDADTGILLFDDLNHIEVEGDGMYLTNLYNLTQPLIRYRISDRLVLLPPAPGCPFTRCRVLPGRQEDIFWLVDPAGREEFLHPLLLEDLCIPGLVDYQFQQTSRNVIEALVQTAPGADREAIGKQLQSGVQQVLNDHGLYFVRFHLTFVEQILPDPHTGKKRLAVPLPRPGASDTNSNTQENAE